MKIIVDYSHLCNRLLHISIMQAKPKKVQGKILTKDYENFFLHLLFNNLRSVKNSFGDDIYLAIDSTSWRKEIYSDYKGHRSKGREESEINYKEFYELINYSLDALKNFDFKIIKVPRAEADDIIGTFCQFEKDNITVISSDKDFEQLLRYKNISLYDPIQKKYKINSVKEAKYKLFTKVLVGDSGDNIPSIKEHTEFSLDFLKFLKQKDIHTKAPENFLKLKISESLIEEFKESGLIIYKKGMFADAGAKKFMLNLGKSLSQNPLYKAHFKRNFNLIDLRRTPKDIQENILNELESAEVNIDSKFILDFFQKHNLRDQLAHADDFIGGSFEVKKVQFDLEDW